jgi:hypothetical protein
LNLVDVDVTRKLAETLRSALTAPPSPSSSSSSSSSSAPPAADAIAAALAALAALEGLPLPRFFATGIAATDLTY